VTDTYTIEDDREILFANDGGRARSMHSRIRLAAAAPAIVRALLVVEWAGWVRNELEDLPSCPHCLNVRGHHDLGCYVDAALTAAGLTDQKSRDEARKEIEERSKR
jgi:hypothetical protein